MQIARKMLKLDAVTGSIIAQVTIPSAAGDAFTLGSWNTVFVDDAYGEFIVTKWSNHNTWDAVNSASIMVFNAGLQLVWQADNLPSGKKHSVTYFDGKVVLGLGNHAQTDPHQTADPTGAWKQLKAYDVRDGSIVWSTDLSAAGFDGSLFNVLHFNGLLVADTQYSYTSSDKVFVFNAQSGALLETFDLGVTATSCAPSIFANGKLYTGDLLGHKTHVVEVLNGFQFDWANAWGDGQMNHNSTGLDLAGMTLAPTLVN